MKPRDFVIILPLLIFALFCYTFGQQAGKRAQKRVDTEFNIRRSLRLLHAAERGDYEKITNGCRMYLLGHTKAYAELVAEADVPDSFRGTLAEARQIAHEVETNLVNVTPKSFDR